MKQAIQLPIPFEDFEQRSTVIVNHAEPSQAPAAPALDRLEHRAIAAGSSLAARAIRLVPSLALIGQAALLVSFGFSLVFLAAIIGG